MMEKLDLHTPNFTDENIAKLAELFPNCVTEVTGEKGKLVKSIDFDLLKQELSHSIVDGAKERYQLNWPGKKEALLTANAPISKTLRPCREESVDFDNTENLFIEGDNLDALKLLQETYLGKVKMIYIDPPYNTGKEFIYADNFSETTDGYLKDSGQKDESGNRLIANTDANGRFHSDWLSMMYSRLRLSKNLLKDDGVIFISIDDNEVSNLRRMCDEIFGEDNWIGTLIWDLPRGNNAGIISRAHESILVYSKDYRRINHFIRPEGPTESIERCNKNVDARHPASWITVKSGLRYEGVDQVLSGKIGENEWIEIDGEMKFENGKLVHDVNLKAGWTMKDMFQNWQKGKRVFDLKGQEVTDFFFKENGRLYSKKIATVKSLKSVIRGLGDTQTGRDEIINLFGKEVFSHPKPTKLLSYLISLCCKEEDLFLDFFAGSAASIHAAMTNSTKFPLRWIAVQIDEKCNENSHAYKDGFSSIAEISKERIRRAGKKIKEENETTAQNLDIGFRVLKISDSNMQEVEKTPDSITQDDLFTYADNIKTDRTSEDLLFQVLLDWGVDLSLPISKETISDHEVFCVDNNALLACFTKDGKITEDFCKELAKREPLRVVFRDAGFENDSVKINVEQIFKLLSPHTDIRTI